MNVKMQSLEDNHSWRLIDLLPNQLDCEVKNEFLDKNTQKDKLVHTFIARVVKGVYSYSRN